ncbi:MAG: hypothetical protein QNJ65_10180 [Xenococcaceae cyanobacterium MO_234.B1]|nr:hypothetical protein [Xenococcaceae cyanobacterium MO_234.B1]
MPPRTDIQPWLTDKTSETFDFSTEKLLKAPLPPLRIFIAESAPKATRQGTRTKRVKSQRSDW